MPISVSDIVVYTSANVPGDDNSTSGGALVTTARPLDTNLSSNSVVAVVSDGTDSRTVTVLGRSTTGVEVTEVIPLNGAVEVVGSLVFERILTITLSASSGTRNVTIRQGSGGSTLHVINANETTAQTLFKRSASSDTGVVRYEKLFARNNNSSLALTNAAVTLVSDPASRIRIGLDTTKGSSLSTSNRLSPPAGVVFSDNDTPITVPTGQLSPGEAIGIWVEEGLLANDPPIKSSFTLRVSGNSI